MIFCERKKNAALSLPQCVTQFTRYNIDRKCRWRKKKMIKRNGPKEIYANRVSCVDFYAPRERKKKVKITKSHTNEIVASSWVSFSFCSIFLFFFPVNRSHFLWIFFLIQFGIDLFLFSNAYSNCFFFYNSSLTLLVFVSNQRRHVWFCWSHICHCRWFANQLFIFSFANQTVLSAQLAPVAHFFPTASTTTALVDRQAQKRSSFRFGFFYVNTNVHAHRSTIAPLFNRKTKAFLSFF